LGAVKRVDPGDVDFSLLLLGCSRMGFFRKKPSFGDPVDEKCVLELECSLIKVVNVTFVVPKALLYGA